MIVLATEPTQAPRAEADDAQLILEIRAGSTDAAEALIRRHWDGARQAAALVVGDVHRGEDLAQEAMLRALDRLSSFDESREFAPWLRRLVVNRCIDWLRSPAARDEVRDPGNLAAQIENNAPELAPESTDPALICALASLSPEDRALVVLRHVLEYSNAEAAELLGISETSASTRRHRAIGVLREALKKEEPDHG